MFLRARKQRSLLRTHGLSRNSLLLESLEDRLLLCAALVLYENEIVVTDTADEIGGDRVSLRDAVLMANDSGQNTRIILPAGEHIVSRDEPGAPDEEVGDLDIMNSSPLTVSTNICVLGANAGESVIDALGLNRAIHVHPGVNVHVAGVTIRGGFADAGGGVLNEGGLAMVDSELDGNIGQRGGAIHNLGALWLDGVDVHDNTAVVGGGVYVGENESLSGSGPATIRSSLFQNNLATQDGGGIADVRTSFEAFTNGAVTLVDSTIHENRSLGRGGGIYSDNSLTIEHSTIDGNVAEYQGGGTHFSGAFGDGRLNIQNSTFSNNTAGDSGGGLSMRYGRPSIHQSTFSGNVAGRWGGGILQNDDVNGLSLTQSTITGNTANARGTSQIPDAGGGIFLEDTVALFNTIVAGNFRACNDCEGPVHDDLTGGLTGSNRASYNLLGVYDGGFEADDVGNIYGTSDLPLVPRLGPLADNGGSTFTHLLLADSPAIDAGQPGIDLADGASLTDQRGRPRFVDGDLDGTAVIDIGSVELQVGEITVPPAAVDDSYLADGLVQTVWREAVLTREDIPALYGRSIALDGDRLLVTRREFESNRGGADVYELRSGVWQFTASLAGDESFSNQFFPVALDGDRAVFVEPRDLNDGGGAVYVFEATGSTWTRVTKLETPIGAYDQTFGVDVDIDGDRIVVGADGFQLTDSGAAYVYELQAGAWTLAQTLTAPAGTNDNTVGGEVGIEGDRIVVFGTYAEDPVTFDWTQTIYVFERDESGWRRTADISPTVATDHFGNTLDLNENQLIVSAADVSIDGIHRAGAFIYEYTNGQWQETGRTMVADEPDRRWDDDDVATVAIDGNTAVVGMDHDDDPGAVYVFRETDGQWTQTDRLFSRTPPRREDNFFVAQLDGRRLVVNDNDFQVIAVHGVSETSAAGTQVLHVDADGGVLHNDAHFSVGGPRIEVPPQHGRVTIGEDGSFAYAAAEDFIGVDMFVYALSGGFHQQDFARVLIDVQPGGPLIAEVIRNDGDGSYAELSSLAFTFREDVVGLSPQDMSLYNETRGSDVDLSDATMSYDVEADTARWDLAALGLTQGRYAATIRVEGTSGTLETLSASVIVALPGDANLDGGVDASDFNTWNENRFQIGTNWFTGDFTSDGVTDSADFNWWLTNRWLSIDDVEDVARAVMTARPPRAPLPGRVTRGAASTTLTVADRASQVASHADWRDSRTKSKGEVVIQDRPTSWTDDTSLFLVDTFRVRRNYQPNPMKASQVLSSESRQALPVWQESSDLADKAMADWRDT